jgi:hypothetical protein
MKGRKGATELTSRETLQVWLCLATVFGFGFAAIWLYYPSSRVPATKGLLNGEDATVTISELEPNIPKLFAYLLKSGVMTEFFS